MAETKEITCGGVRCTLINDEHFSRVRAYFGIPDDFCASTFTFSRLAPAGGKGGDNLTKTDDDLYFIKEMKSGDHKVLKDPIFAKDLADHVTDKEKPSLLAPLVAHFENTENNKIYLALRNCISRPPAPLGKLYDLKGCADDKLMVDNGSKVPEVHKRIWKIHLWLGCGGEARAKYFQGKLEALYHPHIPLMKAQKDSVMEALQNDCSFLEGKGLMDYSLIVGVCEKGQETFETNPEIDIYAGKPLISKSESKELEEVTYLGIIDYLQKWTPAKTAAQIVKSFEHNKATIKPPKYAKRFIDHFDHVLHALDGDLEAQIIRRDNRVLPHRCFPLVRK